MSARIRRYSTIAEKNATALEQLGEQIKPLLDIAKTVLDTTAPNDALDSVERVTIVYDRLVKAELNLVKATDELSRLQSFLSGGPDSRPDLSSMGEIELRQTLRAALKELSITDLSQL